MRKVDVIIPQGYKPPKNDVEVAWILARYYRATVQILQPANRYKVKTPDYEFLGELYELKAITSHQTRQLLVQLENAREQAQNIVIDLRRSKITITRAQVICRNFLAKHPRSKVLLIKTANFVVVIE